jgi:molybdate transport system ATP-binding protein
MNVVEARFRGVAGGFALDVEFAMPGRGVTALFGVSGCGKTSTLRCIAGLERVRDGYLNVNGDIWQDRRQFLPTHRRALGYVFQEPSLFAHLDVRRNLEFGLRRVAAAQRRVQFDEVVSLLGLDDLLRRRPEQLSGGQRQRAAIARALLTSPKLLLLDEPLANLDVDSKAEIMPWLERLTQRLQLPVLLVSHAPAEVQRLADHMLYMEQGRVRAAGPLNELLTRPDLPLAHMDEAGSVVAATVSAHDSEYHLTYVAVPGGRLAVSMRDLAIGQRVRVRVLARDVSLALEPPVHSSISNALPVRIVDIGGDRDAAQALVRLDLAGTPLLARITRRSVAVLNLQPGQTIYAQVKSVALMD